MQGGLFGQEKVNPMSKPNLPQFLPEMLIHGNESRTGS